jgi:hypothetical protein
MVEAAPTEVLIRNGVVRSQRSQPRGKLGNVGQGELRGILFQLRLHWQHGAAKAALLRKKFANAKPSPQLVLIVASYPSAPGRRSEIARRIWGQLETKRVRLSASFCVMRLPPSKNKTRIIAFIDGPVMHVHAPKRNRVAWLRIPPLPPV